MNLNRINKIFVDVDEEVSSIVEKIIGSEENKIILVIPDRALIFASSVSIKVIKRLAYKAKKSLIIVTDDERGHSIVQRIGLIVVSKVSQINPDLWDLAESKIIQFKSERENRIKGQSLVDTFEKKQKEIAETESAEKKKTKKDVVETYTQTLEPSKVLKEEEKDIPRSKNNLEKRKESLNFDHITEKEVENESSFLQKKQQPKSSKIINKKGIQIAIGDDISKLNKKEEDNYAKDEPSINRTFTGRDLNKSDNESFVNKIGDIFTKGLTVVSRAKNSREERTFSSSKKVPLNIKIVLVLIILLPVLIIFYMYQQRNVEIIVELAKDDIDISREVQANTEIQEIDEINFVLPAREIRTPEISRSKTGIATGEFTTGRRASGFVTIYNTTTRQITISEGTTIRNATGDLEYVLLEDVILEPISQDPDAVSDGQESIADDVSIEAVEFGERYNLSDGESNTQFSIEGFPDISEVYAKRFLPFEGGTTEEFTGVSDEDIERVENELLPVIEAESVQDLRLEVEAGWRIIEDTISFELNESVSAPGVGDEIEFNENTDEDPEFTLSVSGATTALIVNCDDLERLAILSLETENGSGSANIRSCDSINITNVTASETRATFTIASQATVSSPVTEESVFEDVRGLAFEDVESFLEGDEKIDRVRASFRPVFLPGFLKTVPDNESRVEIEIREI